MIDKFKVLGQPMTSELRSMTQKSEKCDFADNLISEQARVAIYRPERFLWSVEYNAKSPTPYQPFGGQNAKHICTSERSQYHYISANDGYHSATCTSAMTCTMHILSMRISPAKKNKKKHEVRKLQVLKRCGTQISLI